MTWLPAGFEQPPRLDLTSGHHLRPIREDDVELDYPAVMGSRARLWALYGEAWGWPPATMTFEQDREDLARHEREMAEGASFNYAVLDDGETELVGCVYVDPPATGGEDAVVSWWVVDRHVGSALERALANEVPDWLTGVWGFRAPRYGV